MISVYQNKTFWIGLSANASLLTDCTHGDCEAALSWVDGTQYLHHDPFRVFVSQGERCLWVKKGDRIRSANCAATAPYLCMACIQGVPFALLHKLPYRVWRVSQC